ncbi:MAG: FtsW/RodA/SpoVE family cell cycle protein [Bacteroidetes bacterium]|nr:FtsW/RodA/SpoVE family cell cycle protein [Bacteroidota bacterium]
MQQSVQQYLRGDRGIWLIIALLTLVSVLAVYSTTGALAFRRQDGDTEYYLFRHIIFICLGLLLIYFVHKIDYRLFARFANLLMVISGLLLVYTLLQGAQAEVNEARRWIHIFGQSFQPSDLAKFSLMVYLAKVLTQKQDYIKDFRTSFVPTILPVFVICGLIAPANLSTAILMFMVSLILMFISGISTRHLMLLVASGAVFVILLVSTNLFKRAETWRNRLFDYVTRVASSDYQPSYQVQQSNIAIATGGFLGKGAGKSVQRHYLPHPYSDFVYAIIVEEYGLLGGMIVLALYIMLMIRAVGIVTISKTFGALLAAGLSFLIVIQALINMGVTVGILPVTGLVLPWISMGGTSMLFTGLSLGVILSVSRHALEEKFAE